jgi:hypothetical protein
VQAFIHLKICFMKAKFPILIAAALLVTTVSKAQYGRVYADAQIGIQGQVVFPGSAVIAYNYHNQPRERYDDRRDWRGDGYERFSREHRDWREDEYQRYCHEHREWRGNRDDYYRDHYSYRVAPYCAPRRVVVYGY